VPFGLNVESGSIRRKEIDASVWSSRLNDCAHPRIVSRTAQVPADARVDLRRSGAGQPERLLGKPGMPLFGKVRAS
jgi:uncharacterized protein YcbX